MPQDDGDADRVFLRDEETVRLDFQAASHAVWLEFAALLGLQWESANLGHLAAGRLVQRLGDLAKLRCLPDGRPLPASAAFECLLSEPSRYGKSPLSVVERCVVRDLAGQRRSERSPAEIVALIEAFLRCFAADYERGELAWVDELYAMVRSGGPDAHWTIDLPRLLPAGEDAVVTLNIPRAALEAAGLQAGDRLVVEPRSRGLWIGHASPNDRGA
jgi:GNAT superfamily N-acetyltransferase